MGKARALFNFYLARVRRILIEITNLKLETTTNVKLQDNNMNDQTMGEKDQMKMILLDDITKTDT